MWWEYTLYDVNLLKVSGTCFTSQDLYLSHVSSALLRNIYSTVIAWSILKKSSSSNLITLFTFISLLVFCLLVLWIIERCVLKFTTAIMYFSKQCMSFCFPFFKVLILGTLTFRIIVFLMNWLLNIMKWSSSSLIILFRNAPSLIL